MSLSETAFKYSQEIIGLEHLDELSNIRPIKGYVGTAPTGKPHIAYLCLGIAISRMIKVGIIPTVMIADYHAAMDNNKTDWDSLNARAEYYILAMKSILVACGVSNDKVKFVRGSSFQRKPTYIDDLLKLATKTNFKDAKKANAEVVKCSSNPLIGNLLYPLMQALDEEHLDQDFEFGGVDQRKIMMFSHDKMPSIGYNRKRSYVMYPMIPGLAKGGKMSASVPNSKIDLVDSDTIIAIKCKKAWSIDGQSDHNGVLAIFKLIIFELNDLVCVNRDAKYGGNLEYINFSDMLKDFEEKKVASIDLKNALTKYLIELITPIRKTLLSSGLLDKAYPCPENH
jgi:tyrosyl-tRNA synthetase